MNDDPFKMLDFKPVDKVASGCGCGPLAPLPQSEPSCCGGASAQSQPDQPCCGAPAIKIDWPAPSKELPFVSGEVDSPVGKVPRVSTALTMADHLGNARVRWGYGRMDYGVPPGLYALGAPDSTSEVIVTANYKLTFDVVRKALAGQNLWMVVLDTMAVNVWCAAGKGTFGTDELVHRLESVGLNRLVEHRRIILPQLGAPGVAAHKVKELSGFKVVYGPVRIQDLPMFIKAGRKATDQMRRKRFPLSERAVLIPIELVSALKNGAILMAAFFFASGLGGPGDYWSNVWSSGLLAAVSIFSGLVGGAILTPLLLPWLPGRAFSVKSIPVAVGLVAITLVALGGDMSRWSSLFEAGAWLLMAPALAAYLALNFTGASTYTSLSGVEKEMRFGMPIQIAAAGLGLVLWIGSRIAA